MTRAVTRDVYWLAHCHDLDGRHLHNSPYLIHDDRSSLLVDTGPPSHRDSVVAQIEAIIGDDEELDAIILTKAHIEHAGNLSPLRGRNTEVRVIASSIPENHPDWFGLPEDAEMSGMGDGASMTIGGREFSFLVPPLNDVSYAMWIYDHRSKTLFTADGFGHFHLPGEYCTGKSDALGSIDYQHVRRFYEEMFPWLPYTDTEALLADLDTLLGSHEIDWIAPTHGNPIAGADLDEAVALLSRALPDVQGWDVGGA